MNEEQKKNIAIILAALVALASVTIMVITIIESENSKLDSNEFEFLKAFASYHIDETDPNWQCKKAVGLYELAKQDYPHFVENTKWLADKKCGFDVNNITP